MKEKVSLDICHPRKIQTVRNKIAEDVVKEHIHKFFVGEKPSYTIAKDDRKMMVSLEVISLMRDSMKGLRSIFWRTKIKGWAEKYREGLLRLLNAITEMSVTPDLTLILQVLVWKGGFFDLKNSIFDIALVEIKRGKARLRDDQKKDVDKAEEKGIPYYLVRVDDSDFLHGKFTLELKPLTSKLLSSAPK